MFCGILQSGQRLSEADWKRIDPRFDRLEIEIGPGDCHYLSKASTQRPETLFVGFEMRSSTVHAVRARGPLPVNVRLLHTDGRWVVENLLAEACVDAYHAYFPDPWWKKRHHKRRLFRAGFAAALASSLKPGGCLYLITDVAATFVTAEDRLLEAGLLRLDWQRDPTADACSSYERKYRLQGRRLYQARFVKA